MDVASTEIMGKDDFLKLFVCQLKNQNPLKPMDSTEFTSQLAQFSSLEQLHNINDNLKDIVAYQSSLNNGLSAGFIGRQVSWGSGQSGTVMGVSFDDGVTYLVTDDGQRVALGEINEIYAKDSALS